MDKMKIATIAIIIVIIGWLIWIIKFDVNEDSEGGASGKEVIRENKDQVFIDGEIRGIWISYLDLSPMLTGKSEKEFTKNIESAFENVRDFGFNTVIVQVRPFSDALYESKYYPWSFICTGEEGENPGYDPLKIMIKEAHDIDLRVEAWINPYRVRNTTSKAAITSKSPASKWMDEGSDSVIEYNGGVYLNPGRDDVRELIVNGVREIVENYNVDGIHFDDYFYPSTESYIDEEAFGNYLLNEGTLSLEDWRRENVNILVREVYEAIKKIDTKVLFGISPQGSMNNNYNSQYIDVEKWVQNKGYVDYICPQVYYGFENQNSDYISTVERFNSMITESSVDLYIGLAGYKIGLEDKWAGTGSQEWINNSDIMKRQVEASRGLDKSSGVFIYRYASLFNPDSQVENQVKGELENLKDAF